ncbi:MAG TPA: CoA-binding protein [Candidatus Acidoferrales bacterium]|nr:CoA-binding protein [Candidatus Acidoferrales bacterium]
MNSPTNPLDSGHSRSAGDVDPIAQILKSARVIAVVGLSSKRFRPSYGVAEYLQSAGYRILPVNPNEREVLGEKCYARLEDIAEKVDIVDIFRRPETVAEVVESAIRIGARAVWMQEGVIDSGAAERARQAGLVAVMDVCILKEHRKRFRLREP